MSTHFAVTEKNIDRAMLVLRVVLGVIFIAHGYQKVFTYGFSGVTTSMAQTGIPLPSLVAPIISILELVGGIALLFGAFTRVVAILIACEMLGAIIFVHAKAGFFNPKGFEYPLSNLAMLVAVALIGAGAYSIDAMFARRGTIAP
jgi:putative oxidoreductase